MNVNLTLSKEDRMKSDTVIYNTSPNKPSTHFGWNLEDNGYTNEGFFTKKRGDLTLHDLCCQTNYPDFYQWVSPSINQERWNSPGTWSPYDYGKLVGRFIPHFFFIYNDGGVIKQLHVPSIKKGTMKYRELTIPEVTSFINDQLWRVKNILNPDPESVLGKVFNTEWLDGSHGNIFPISISKMDIEHFLPRLHFIDGSYVIPLPTPVEVKQKFRDSIWRTKIQMVQLEYTLIPSTEENVISHFSQRVGEVYTSEELHQELDFLNFCLDSGDGRTRQLNNLLNPEGMKLEKVRKRVKGTRVTLYQVKQVQLTPTLCQEFDYTQVVKAT